MPKNEKISELAGLGERIRYLRQRDHLSQHDLALKLGYKRSSTVSNLEMGRTPPDFTLLQRLGTVFNINLHWLITGNPSPDGEAWRSSYMELLRTYDRLAAEVIDRLSVELADRKKERNGLRERESRGDQTVPFGLADRLDEDYIRPREAKIERIKTEQKKALERYTGRPEKS
jgi:transcriptional regulator with XRE-family HTH domain